MNNYSEITLLFLKSLRDTVCIDFLPNTIKRSDDDIEIVFYENDYTVVENFDEYVPSMPKQYNSYSKQTNDIPVFTPELRDIFLRFFSEYERNKDKASSTFLKKGFTLLHLIEDLQFDIFLWLASEILFRTPEEYDKALMSNYISFESKNSNTSGYTCSDKEWIKFKKKRELLTRRIKSFPMPPHFFFIYSDSRIKAEKGKYRINPSIEFFKNDEVYKNSNLNDFFGFEEIIHKAYEHKTCIIVEQGVQATPSMLLDYLVDSYIERVYGFNLVRHAIMSFAIKDRVMDDFAYHENSPLGFTKMAKSNDMVFSKIDFLEIFSESYCYLDLFKAAKKSFGFVACKTLDRFINDYTHVYGFNPILALNDSSKFKKIFNDLSIVCNELDDGRDSKRILSNEKLPLDSLSDYWRKLIGKHLVDPQKLLSEGELGEDYFTHMRYFKKMQF